MVARSADTARGLLCVSLLSDHSTGPPLAVLNTPRAASSTPPRHPSVCALLKLKETIALLTKLWLQHCRCVMWVRTQQISSVHLFCTD